MKKEIGSRNHGAILLAGLLRHSYLAPLHCAGRLPRDDASEPGSHRHACRSVGGGQSQPRSLLKVTLGCVRLAVHHRPLNLKQIKQSCRFESVLECTPSRLASPVSIPSLVKGAPIKHLNISQGANEDWKESQTHGPSGKFGPKHGELSLPIPGSRSRTLAGIGSNAELSHPDGRNLLIQSLQKIVWQFLRHLNMAITRPIGSTPRYIIQKHLDANVVL